MRPLSCLTAITITSHPIPSRLVLSTTMTMTMERRDCLLFHSIPFHYLSQYWNRWGFPDRVVYTACNHYHYHSFDTPEIQWYYQNDRLFETEPTIPYHCSCSIIYYPNIELIRWWLPDFLVCTDGYWISRVRVHVHMFAAVLGFILAYAQINPRN